ncbi:hypothetical protein WJX82_006599 [Trebouxia sp. C0006]
MSSSGSKRRFESLQPSRIPKPNPEASQDQAARALRSKGSRIPLPSQASKPQFRRPDPTTTDKLITDYLSRHAVSGNVSFSKQRLGRQPLASMENLQEALSELQLAVKSSRQAYAPATIADRLTPYFTPNSLSRHHCYGSCSQPSPPGATEEFWYTPNSADSSTCIDNAFLEDSSTHSRPIDAQTSPGSVIDRADSPSLLYGEGSAFSKEVLEESISSLGQWLTM